MQCLKKKNKTTKTTFRATWKNQRTTQENLLFSWISKWHLTMVPYTLMQAYEEIKLTWDEGKDPSYR